MGIIFYVASLPYLQVQIGNIHQLNEKSAKSTLAVQQIKIKYNRTGAYPYGLYVCMWPIIVLYRRHFHLNTNELRHISNATADALFDTFPLPSAPNPNWDPHLVVLEISGNIPRLQKILEISPNLSELSHLDPICYHRHTMTFASNRTSARRDGK